MIGQHYRMWRSAGFTRIGAVLFTMMDIAIYPYCKALENRVPETADFGKFRRGPLNYEIWYETDDGYPCYVLVDVTDGHVCEFATNPKYKLAHTFNAKSEMEASSIFETFLENIWHIDSKQAY